VKIVWIADQPTQGPLVRAEAVMTRRDLDVDGLVLSTRAPEAFGRLPGLGVECVTVGCCGDESLSTQLDALDFDVIVADWQSWEIARDDGRPVMTIGFAHRRDEGLGWDLDEMPLHPWGNESCLRQTSPIMRRREMRRRLGIGEHELVVMTMSSTTYPGSVESRLGEVVECADGRSFFAYRTDVRHVVAETALEFFAADLVVTNAGWATSTEARWSGVPHVLLMLGGLDQPARACGDVRSSVMSLTPHRPAETDELVVDNVPDFLDACELLIEKHAETIYD
jgi:hypothetical protein